MLWQPDAPLPAWVRFAPPRLRPQVKRRLVLGSATVVAAAATVGFTAWSANTRSRYNSATTAPSELGTLDQNNRLAFGLAVGSGVVTAGLAATTALLWTTKADRIP